SQASFTIVLDKPSSQTVTVNYATVNNTAIGGSDFQSLNGSVSFAPGETAKTVSVFLINDTQTEGVETFNFQLSNAGNGTLVDSLAVGTIGANDSATTGALPTISVADVVVNEKDGVATFVFTLSRPSADIVSVRAETFSQTASAASDITDIDITVSFTPGQTTEVVVVPIVNDTTVEQAETFGLFLSNPLNLTLSDTEAVGTILDNDGTSPNTFTGTTNNDILNGTTSADTLIGLAGNDTYTLNNSGDVVVENPNEGTDTVKSDITYTLPDNVEKLTLNGSSNLNGTGNALNNTLTGNSGANTLTGLAGNDTIDGKTGADTMIGGLGNDTYTVDNIGDVVIENPNEGTDTVKSSISYILGANLENLTLTGSANLNGTGNALNNKLTGNTGANILNGGAGADTLAGKDGNDTFVFQFGQSTVTALDRISDFAIGADKIDLLTQGGAALNKPAGFTRAADSATTNINTIVTNVFADSNGATAGNQALGVNRAALVQAGTSTYLIVNDGTSGFQSANDLVINLTGITGALPALGTIPVANFFV
ncbi:MAG: hyalin, partial [Cyanobacteria bacterium RI_101]|nr:hyalin [Cyanobacteria bacterium RI_101]